MADTKTLPKFRPVGLEQVVKKDAVEASKMYFGYAFETKDQEVLLTKYNSQHRRPDINRLLS